MKIGCMLFSLSPTQQAGEGLITDNTCAGRFVYSFASRRWKKQPELVLTDRARDILQLSVQGVSTAWGGEALFTDATTVQFHTKRLF